MTFWQKIKNGFQKMMTGRNGADEFSLALLITGLILSILNGFVDTFILSMLGMAAYFWSIFRMVSRNTEKRRAENQKYLAFWKNLSSNVRQTMTRLKQSKDYKYFKCPECHARLRLPRKVGQVTVTCGKCHHAFKQKA